MHVQLGKKDFWTLTPVLTHACVLIDVDNFNRILHARQVMINHDIFRFHLVIKNCKKK